MSYSVPVVPAESGRPRTVTVAGYLLYLVAAIVVIRALLSVTSIGATADALRTAYAGQTNPTPDQVATVYQGVAIASVIVSIIIAAGLAVLAAFDLRGRQGARITTWVIGGIGRGRMAGPRRVGHNQGA